MYKSLAAILTATAFTAGCSAGQTSQNSGPKTVITDAQFSEVKSNCNLGGATLHATNSTKTTTDANGVKVTITTKYKDAPEDGKSIQLPEGMAEGDIAMAIPCLKGEFERLNVVEAPLALPKGMGF